MASHESKSAEIDTVITPSDQSDPSDLGSENSDIVLLSAVGSLPTGWSECAHSGLTEEGASTPDGTADNHIGTSHLLHTDGVCSGDDDDLEFESQDDIESTGVIDNTSVSATIPSRISRSPPPMPGLPEMALALVPYDPVPDGDAAAGPPGPPPPLFPSSDSDAAMDDVTGAGANDTNETDDDDSSGITYIDRSYGSRHTGFGHTGVGAHSCSHCKIVGQCIMCGYLFRAYPGGWQTLAFAARDNHDDERPSRRARLE